VSTIVAVIPAADRGSAALPPPSAWSPRRADRGPRVAVERKRTRALPPRAPITPRRSPRRLVADPASSPDIEAGRIEGIVAHDLGEPMERDGPGHAVAEAVPQVVRADVDDPRQRRVLREQIPECPRGERPAALLGGEQAGRVRRQRRQPGTEGRPRGAVERHLPVLVPLPVHRDLAAARDDGQIRPLQVAQFLGAQPGVQRRDQEGPVAWGAMRRDRREQRGLFLVAEVAGCSRHAGYELHRPGRVEGEEAPVARPAAVALKD